MQLAHQEEPNEVLTAFAEYVAQVVRDGAEELTAKWLQSLIARLDLEPRSIFPSQSLLNHIPLVLRSIADFVAACNEDTLARQQVVDDLEILARMRRRQGYGLPEILEEFRILADLLFGVVRGAASSFGPEVPPPVVVELVRRVHHALGEIQVITATSYGHSASVDRQERALLAARYGSLLAHEIRNRLNHVKIALEVWAGADDASPAADDTLETTLRSNLDNLERLAYDLRTLVFVPSARDSGWSRSQPLDAVISRLVETSKAVAIESGIIISVDAPFPDVAVDASRLELTLVNLLANAINYSDPYKVERSIHIRHTHLEEDNLLRIEVEDNGTGIPEARQGDIGAEDYRGCDHDEFKSIGFGLALAKEAIEQMGGELWLESRYGQGSTFFLTVPTGTTDLQTRE